MLSSSCMKKVYYRPSTPSTTRSLRTPNSRVKNVIHSARTACLCLANDDTIVMSWLMSSKPKRTVPDGICLHLGGQRDYPVRCWVGVCHWDTETLPISGTSLYSLYECTTPGLDFEVFCFHESLIKRN